MIVVGLDTGSGKWHATIRRDGQFFMHGKEVRPQREHVDVRRNRLALSFRGFLDWVMNLGSVLTGEEVHVACEEPLALQNGRTTRTLGLAAGALWAQHLERDMFWHWIDVASWQSMVGVSSRDSTAERKRKSLEYSVREGARIDLDEDHYDADCCSLWLYDQLMKG